MSCGPATAPACDAIREALPAFVAGERGAEVLDLDGATIDAHLDACAACRAERDDAAEVRSLLAAAAPIVNETADGADGLARLLAAVAATPHETAAPVTPARTPAKPLPLRAWLASAAAAALVAGTALGVASMDLGRGDRARRGTPTTQLDVIAGELLAEGSASPLARAKWGQPVVAGAGGATIQSPNVWTSAVRAGTKLTPFASGLHIASGATLLHVVPGNSAVLVETPHARVSILGTILSVSVDADGTRVAVYHGRVQVDGLDGRGGQGLLVVEAGRAVALAADRAPTIKAAAPAPPDWLSTSVSTSATPTATLVAPTARLRAGATAWFRFTLTNPGPGLCVLTAPNARDPNFAIAVTRTGDRAGATQVQQRVAVQPGSATRIAVAGQVVLGPGESYGVMCNVGANLTAPGHYSLEARYAVTEGPAGSFVGTVASKSPCNVDVTR